MSGYDTGMHGTGEDTDPEEQAYLEGRAEQKAKDDAEIARLRRERDEAREETEYLRAKWESRTGQSEMWDDLCAAHAEIARLLRERAELDRENGELGGDVLKMANALVERDALAARVEALEGALKPFVQFARAAVDEEGWSGSYQKDRIVDWFGPSDFRALLSPREPREFREEFER